MLAKLDAKLDAYQEKASADRKTAKEEMLARMDANMKSYQEKTVACQVDTKPAVAQEEEFPEIIPVGETMACQEMEARPEDGKPASANKKPEAAELREVPAEGAEVMPVGEPKKKGVGTESDEI